MCGILTNIYYILIYTIAIYIPYIWFKCAIFKADIVRQIMLNIPWSIWVLKTIALWLWVKPIAPRKAPGTRLRLLENT
jgi:hypothetical protein